MQKILFIFLIFVFVLSPFLSFGDGRILLSWKDIGTLKTTEDQLVKFAGPPTSVILFPEDYFQIKNYVHPKNQVFEYYGYIGKNDNPILFSKSPLSITDEVASIKARFVFQSGFVKIYSYEFGMIPEQNISREKYLNIFSAILGEPVRYSEIRGIFTYYYKNDLALIFWPDTPARFKIELQFHPNNN